VAVALILIWPFQPATRHSRPAAAQTEPGTFDRPASEPERNPGTNFPASPQGLTRTPERGEPTAHLLWPGGQVLDVRETPALNGLTTRITLVRPADFPHAIYVEEQFNALEADEAGRLVRRFEAVASHLLVKLREGQAPETLAALARQFGGSVRPHPSAARLYFVDLSRLEIQGVSWAQSLLNQYPDVIEYAEPDPIVRAAATTPNDPRFAEQWGLNNTDPPGTFQPADIAAPAGWDLRRDASNVVVAVVDSGIRYTHEDLAPNMWRNPGEIAGNGINDDANGFVDDVFGINVINDSSDSADDLPDPVLGLGGHGTSVAGIIGAAGNNNRGVAGVAWKVQLMALKWFNN